MNTENRRRIELTLTIDGQPLTTKDDDWDVQGLLGHAGRDPRRYDLARVEPDGSFTVLGDKRVLKVRDGDTFVTLLLWVSVNKTVFAVDDENQTGQSLKALAIAAGAKLAADDVLSRKRNDGTEKVIPDSEAITLKQGQTFWAVPGDDNS